MMFDVIKMSKSVNPPGINLWEIGKSITISKSDNINEIQFMNYIIQTPSARRLKEEILKSVSEKADSNGNGIATWQCVETDGGDKALVLIEGQWAEKGCIILTQVAGRNELQVRFFYWETCEDKENSDDKYMLGRFTELLLAHFHYFIDRVIIE